MSNKFCSTCGKPVHRPDDKHHMDDHHHHYDDFKHHDRHHHHDHEHGHHDRHHHHADHHDHHHHREDCICEKFLRDDHFRVRLGGLAHGLNFRLRQLIGCVVKLKVSGEGGSKKILAEICYVGNNFIEVKILDKHDHDDHSKDDDDRDGAVWRKHDDDRDHRRRRRRKRDRRHHHDHHDKKFAIFPLRSIDWFVLHDDCDCDHHCGHDCDCQCHY